MIYDSGSTNELRQIYCLIALHSPQNDWIGQLSEMHSASILLCCASHKCWPWQNVEEPTTVLLRLLFSATFLHARPQDRRRIGQGKHAIRRTDPLAPRMMKAKPHAMLLLRRGDFIRPSHCSAPNEIAVGTAMHKIDGSKPRLCGFFKLPSLVDTSSLAFNPWVQYNIRSNFTQK